MITNNYIPIGDDVTQYIHHERSLIQGITDTSLTLLVDYKLTASYKTGKNRQIVKNKALRGFDARITFGMRTREVTIHSPDVFMYGKANSVNYKKSVEHYHKKILRMRDIFLELRNVAERDSFDINIKEFLPTDISHFSSAITVSNFKNDGIKPTCYVLSVASCESKFILWLDKKDAIEVSNRIITCIDRQLPAITPFL